MQTHSTIDNVEVPALVSRLASQLNLTVVMKKGDCRWVLAHPLHGLDKPDPTFTSDSPCGTAFIVSHIDGNEAEPQQKLTITPFIYEAESIDRYINSFGTDPFVSPYVELWANPSNDEDLAKFDERVNEHLISTHYVQQSLAAAIESLSIQCDKESKANVKTQFSDLLDKKTRTRTAASSATGAFDCQLHTDQDCEPAININGQLSLRHLARLKQFLHECDVLDRQAESQRAGLARTMAKRVEATARAHLGEHIAQQLDAAAIESVLKSWLDEKTMRLNTLPALYNGEDEFEQNLEATLHDIRAWLAEFASEQQQCTFAKPNPALLIHLRTHIRNAAQGAHQQTEDASSHPTPRS